MRKLIFFFTLVASMFLFQACPVQLPPEAGFEDMERLTIYDYIVENDSLYSKFRQILEKGGLDKTMDAYNPNGNDYTLFLPTNQAIDEFISSSGRFSSFDDLLNDKSYIAAMARYHVVNMGIITNDFPFGALPELNLTGQYLTIGFEIGKDSSYYKVNNVAPVSAGNIEVSNGYIHVITKALTPITYTTYQWLVGNPEFSIFTEAVEMTGLDEILNRVVAADSSSLNPVTLFAEPDSVYKRNNIHSFNDLAQKVSPGNSDYKNTFNRLNNFIACHIIDGGIFLSDFEGKSTNYNTYGDVPVNVNGKGIDLAINVGKEVFDTIVSSGNDTTFVDYLTFYYDLSNVLTQSGTIHFINQILNPHKASTSEQYFEFNEEPLFNQFRVEGGEFIIEDKSLLKTISWVGGNDQLLFVMSDDESEEAWNKDYLMIQGDFSLNYTLPKIAEGNYTLSIRVQTNYEDNAVIETFLDGVKIGGLIDLTSGSPGNPPYYTEIELGTVSFLSYDSHVLTIKSLIPGFFYWDAVHFDVIK